MYFCWYIIWSVLHVLRSIYAQFHNAWCLKSPSHPNALDSSVHMPGFTLLVLFMSSRVFSVFCGREAFGEICDIVRCKHKLSTDDAPFFELKSDQYTEWKTNILAPLPKYTTHLTFFALQTVSHWDGSKMHFKMFSVVHKFNMFRHWIMVERVKNLT